MVTWVLATRFPRSVLWRRVRLRARAPGAACTPAILVRYSAGPRPSDGGRGDRLGRGDGTVDGRGVQRRAGQDRAGGFGEQRRVADIGQADRGLRALARPASSAPRRRRRWRSRRSCASASRKPSHARPAAARDADAGHDLARAAAMSNRRPGRTRGPLLRAPGAAESRGSSRPGTASAPACRCQDRRWRRCRRWCRALRTCGSAITSAVSRMIGSAAASSSEAISSAIVVVAPITMRSRPRAAHRAVR